MRWESTDKAKVNTRTKSGTFGCRRTAHITREGQGKHTPRFAGDRIEQKLRGTVKAVAAEKRTKEYLDREGGKSNSFQTWLLESKAHRVDILVGAAIAGRVEADYV